jgi:hypothetical protein
MTSEGSKFFNQHRSELMNAMTNSGLNIAEFKLDSSSQMGNNSQGKGFSDNSGSQFAGHKQGEGFHSEQNQRDHDSNKRRELWEQFSKEAA